jgi:hypothetical protein
VDIPRLDLPGEPHLYPFAVVAHPVGSLTRAELDARAASATPQVIAILTGGS